MTGTTPVVVVRAGPEEIDFANKMVDSLPSSSPGKLPHCCCRSYTACDYEEVFQCGFCAEQSPTTWCRTEHPDVSNVTFRQVAEETITTKDGAEVTCTVSNVVPAPASS